MHWIASCIKLATGIGTSYPRPNSIAGIICLVDRAKAKMAGSKWPRNTIRGQASYLWSSINWKWIPMESLGSMLMAL